MKNLNISNLANFCFMTIFIKNLTFFSLNFTTQNLVSIAFIAIKLTGLVAHHVCNH